MKDSLNPVNSVRVEEVDIDNIDNIIYVSEDEEVIESVISDNINKLKGEIEFGESSLVSLHSSISNEKEETKENTQKMKETDNKSGVVQDILENKATVSNIERDAI